MKHIKDYFPFEVNPEQEAAAEALEAFVDIDDENQILILKGHAGTGKTLMLKALGEYLKDIRHIKYLSTTGRAGKVLADKTNTTVETIHRHIYRMKEQSFGYDQDARRKLRFELKNNVNSYTTLYAVDESSMLSNNLLKNQMLSFGTGRLMTDLMYFIGSRKIIFTGDPSQLPPPSTDFSAALNSEYIYEHFNKRPVEINLTQVMRYDRSSFIGNTTQQLRDYIASQQFPLLSIKVTGYDHVKLFNHPHDMACHYASRMHSKGMEHQIMITFSNAAAFDLNEQIRRHYYKGINSMKAGDLLMVYQNNYLYDLYNGDQVYVAEIHGPIETHFGFHYLDVTLKQKGGRKDRLIKAKLQMDFMNRKKPYLQAEEENRMMMDAAIRANKHGFKSDSREFLNFISEDIYLNALRVKFGYAVTAHKSQGGEWEDVYIVIEKSMFYMKKSFQYRWMYTALSRAQENIFITSNRCLY